MSFNPGEQVGPYRIMEQLGQGGMATVYKAYHPSLDRYVAIKVLHQAFLEDPNFTARFQREARVVARLEHANIVPIYDYAEHEKRPYLVMKFIEGETLKARLQRGPLSPSEVEEIVVSVGAGLGYAHRQGILHRDIKPSNVMLAKDGQIYLADFGLARIAQSGESTLTSDMVLGTPQYISPEQAMAKKDLDAGTDIYSFGVMLYEMTVGRVPFSGDTPFAVIHDHIYAPLPLPSDVNPRIASDLERVLLKALAKERADRFVDVPELIRAFKEAWKNQAPTLVTASQPESASQAAPVSPAATGSAPLTVRAEPAPAPTPGISATPTVKAELPAPTVAQKRKGLPRWVWIASTAVLLILLAVAGLLLLRVRARRMAAAGTQATKTAAAAIRDTPLPPPPTLTPRPSPTLPPPPPTFTPVPVIPAAPTPKGPLYEINFDDNKLLPGWNIDPKNWAIQQGALCGKGHGWARFEGGQKWNDYVARFRLKISTGVIHLNVRQSNFPNGVNRYFIYVDRAGVALSRQRLDKVENNLASAKYPFVRDQWYTIEVAVQGNHLALFVDGLRLLEYDDTKMFSMGFISFETMDATSACVDDLVVTDLSGQPPFDMLYGQNFEAEAALLNWTSLDAQAKPNHAWQIQEGALCANGHNYAVLTTQTFTNFEANFRLLPRSAVHVNFHIRLDPWSRYFLAINPLDNAVPVIKQLGGDPALLGTSVRMNFTPNHWYTVTIVVVDGRIVVRIDDRKIFDYTDKEPITEGAIAFETVDEQNTAMVCVDDLAVRRPPYIPKP